MLMPSASCSRSAASASISSRTVAAAADLGRSNFDGQLVEPSQDFLRHPRRGRANPGSFARAGGAAVRQIQQGGNA